MKVKVEYVIILCLVLIIVLMKQCHKCKCPDTVFKDTTINQIDTIFSDTVTRIIYKNKPIIMYEKVIVPMKVDTLFILKDYYTQRVYDTTLLNDTSYKLRIIDTVFKNTIKNRVVHFSNLRPTVIQTKIVTENCKVKNKMFVGFGVGSDYINKTKFLTKCNISLNLALLTKKDNLYSLNIDPINRYFYFNTFYKIKI